MRRSDSTPASVLPVLLEALEDLGRDLRRQTPDHVGGVLQGSAADHVGEVFRVDIFELVADRLRVFVEQQI
jgi:hypothetical protein